MRKTDAMSTFTTNIRACLEAYGWTARDLCASSGIHEVNMSRILNGKENLSLKRAEAIADALEISLSDLLSENFEIPAATH